MGIQYSSVHLFQFVWVQFVKFLWFCREFVLYGMYACVCRCVCVCVRREGRGGSLSGQVGCGGGYGRRPNADRDMVAGRDTEST